MEPIKIATIIRRKHHKTIEVADPANPAVKITVEQWAYQFDSGDKGLRIGGTKENGEWPVGQRMAYTLDGLKIIPQAMPASAPAPASHPLPAAAHQPAGTRPDKDTLIVRQSSAKTAAEVYAAMVASRATAHSAQQAAETVVEIARLIERYVNGPVQQP